MRTFGPVLMMAIAAVLPALAAEDPLASYRGKTRLLVVLAASDADPELKAQRRLYTGEAKGNRERDLLIVEALDGTDLGRTLRRRFEVPAGEFRAILVGKDGGAKLRSALPIPSDTLFAEIDAMPMRQDETRRAPPK